MSTERTITLRKYVCASNEVSEEGKAFHFMCSTKPTRDKKGKGVYSVDGLFAPELLPGLKYEDDAVEVDCTISLDYHEGSWREMWCASSRIESRFISPFRPIFRGRTRDNDADRFSIKCGDMYLDSWCQEKYFEQMPEGDIFPVWVKVERIKD